RLKREAVEIVRQIDVLRSQPPRADDALEAEIAAARQALPAAAPASATAPEGGAGAFCTQCGAPAAPSDRFCGACGTPLRQTG
ncbi:MAG TPA: zinc ribbon domain-containing protein, partial [Acidobacteriota bacterium]